MVQDEEGDMTSEIVERFECDAKKALEAHAIDRSEVMALEMVEYALEA